MFSKNNRRLRNYSLFQGAASTAISEQQQLSNGGDLETAVVEEELQSTKSANNNNTTTTTTTSIPTIPIMSLIHKDNNDDADDDTSDEDEDEDEESIIIPNTTSSSSSSSSSNNGLLTTPRSRHHPLNIDHSDLSLLSPSSTSSSPSTPTASTVVKHHSPRGLAIVGAILGRFSPRHQQNRATISSPMSPITPQSTSSSSMLSSPYTPSPMSTSTTSNTSLINMSPLLPSTNTAATTSNTTTGIAVSDRTKNTSVITGRSRPVQSMIIQSTTAINKGKNGFDTFDEEEDREVRKRRHRSKTNSTMISIYDFEQLQRRILEVDDGSGDNEDHQSNNNNKKGINKRRDKKASTDPISTLRRVVGGMKGDGKSAAAITHSDSDEESAKGGAGIEAAATKKTLHVGIPKLNLTNSNNQDQAILESPKRHMSLSSWKQTLLSGGGGSSSSRSPKSLGSSPVSPNPLDNMTPRSRKRSLSLAVGESIRRLKDTISSKSESVECSPRSRMKAIQMQNAPMLAMSYEHMKQQYVDMSATDVIQLEKKRMTDQFTFSPKLILEHMNRDGMLDPRWNNRCEVIFHRELDRSASFKKLIHS